MYCPKNLVCDIEREATREASSSAVRPLRHPMASESDLDDLAGFLGSPSPQLRKAAADIVQGLSGTEDGIRALVSKSSLLLPPLLKLIGNDEELSKIAGEALVNLSQDEKLAEGLIDAEAVGKVMELLEKGGCRIIRLLVMLLVNLTQVESGAMRVIQGGDGKVAGLYVGKLVRFFTRFSGNKQGEDAFEHVASILVNITRIREGRALVLDQKRGLLRQILPQIDSRSLVRRQGVAGSVRNCCFEADTELPSLLLTSQFLWPALLLPLAGKKAYIEKDTASMPAELATPLSFEREPEEDPQVRLEAAEALYLLALQEGGRRALWSVNGARILQVGYEDEEDPKVMEAYEKLGLLLVEETITQEEN